MTPEQRELIDKLKQCRFAVGSYDKRFVNDMSVKPDNYQLTDKQASFLEKLAHRYRRQLAKGGV